MTNQEIIAHQQRAKQFNETELGNLFNRFVNLHATAWQFLVLEAEIKKHFGVEE